MRLFRFIKGYIEHSKILEGIIISLILLFTVIVSWPLLQNGYFFHQDDAQVIRIYEMRQCFEDGQFPCRWVSNMGYGNGFPLFNYYPVLPYYAGALLSFIAGYLMSVKILFAGTFFIASFGMYKLGSALYGRWIGLMTAILYLFLPYRALDVYIRGALAESFALAILPWVLWSAHLTVHQANRKNFALLTISVASLLLSHNIMSLLFLPILGVIVLFWLLQKGWTGWKRCLLAVGLGIGLATFFVAPALLEKNLVTTDNLLRFGLNFRANYVDINQLLFDQRPAVLSSGLEVSQMIYQIGWPYWWGAVISFPIVCWLIFYYVYRKNFRTNKIFFHLQAGLFLAVFVFTVFMTHNKSAVVWENLPLIAYTQFPWRFLGIAGLFSVLVWGYLISLASVKRSLALTLGTIVIILTILFNQSLFRTLMVFPISDSVKLTGLQWQEQQKASILDYLPIISRVPQELAPTQPIVNAGEVEISNFMKKSNSFKFNAVVYSPSNIELPIFDFPQWVVAANGLKIPIDHNNYLGRISVSLQPGTYQITGNFEDTIVRKISNVVSLLSFGLLLLALFHPLRKKYDNLP